MSNRHIDRKAVVKLAQEAGLSVQEGNSFADDMYISVLYRFANLVASQDSDRVALSVDGCNSAHEALQHELSMIGSAIESFDSTAAALRALIDWHCAVAADPKVNGGMVLVPVSAMPAERADKHASERAALYNRGWDDCRSTVLAAAKETEDE